MKLNCQAGAYKRDIEETLIIMRFSIYYSYIYVCNANKTPAAKGDPSSQHKCAARGAYKIQHFYFA